MSRQDTVGGLIAEKLTRIADASRRADGTDIPLGEQCREGASEIAYLRSLLAELSADTKWQNAPYELLKRARAAFAKTGAV